MAGPTMQVDAPKRNKRTGGLSDVAEFRSNGRLGVAETVVFQSDGCGFPETEESRCYAAETPEDKKFSGVPFDDAIGSTVTLYAGVKCFVAPNPDEVEKARANLEEGRDRVLEGILATWAGGGTAVTAGSSPKNAVARVDHALDKGYRGQGVILMSRFDANDAGLEYTEGEPLRTKTGTPVVASGFIEPGKVYGVGAIAVEQGEVVERDVIEPQKNTHWALAEQEHTILVDCEFRVVSTITA